MGNVDAFEGISANIPVTIPCSSLDSYQYAYGWSRFTNYETTLTYEFSVSSDDPNRGGVSIITQPTCDFRQAEFQANAYNGFRFDHWSDGNIDNPRYLVVTQDTALTAYFVSTDGIDNINNNLSNATITANGSQILVSNAANQRIRIFDNLGRLISTTLNAEETSVFNMPSSGVYLVQVGNAPAQRVVVVK